MCGIAGIIGRWPGADLTRFRDRAVELMAHRGPNGYGCVSWRGMAFSDSREGAVDASADGVLVHRRLSIIDLSDAANQPMLSSDGARAIVFNGEIYNYLELRKELSNEQLKLRSTGDTAVLLEWVGEHGFGKLDRACGMFAFAHVDLHRRSFLIARDGLGIKPLFIARKYGALAFASEPSVLLELPGISRRADEAQSIRALRLGMAPPRQQSIYADLEEVEAGHGISGSIDASSARYVRWWSPPEERAYRGSADDAAVELQSAFLYSLEMHLRSDRRVGSALSGGLDSSSVVCGMRRLHPSDLDIECVSFVAEAEKISEERWARLVAGDAGARIHPVLSASTSLQEDFDDYVLAQGEPVGGTSGYAQYCVYREAQRQGLTVMLDGQGPDEMMAGYTFFLDTRLSELVRSRQLSAALRLSRSPFAAASGLGSARRVARAALVSLRDAVRIGGNPRLGRSWIQTVDVDQRDALAEALPPRNEGLAAHLRFSTQNGLVNLFRLADRNAMRFSIENRVPWATTQIADLVFSFPVEHFFGAQGESKAVLRKAMRGIVPAAVLERRDKIGFANDDAVNLMKLRALVEDTLASSSQSPYVNGQQLRTLWRRFLSGDAAVVGEIWNAVAFLRWWQVCRVQA